MAHSEDVELPAADPTDQADPEIDEGDAVPPGAVVVGVDGSDKDTSVLDFAALEAGRSGAPLQLVMAQEIHTGIVGTWDAGFALDGMGTELASATAEKLERIAPGVKAAHPDLDVSRSHPWGTPSQVLLDAATHALLVVVGTQRKSDLEKALLGTTSLDTAMHASCPVAVVGFDPIRPGPVVVGVDGSAHAVPGSWS